MGYYKLKIKEYTWKSKIKSEKSSIMDKMWTRCMQHWGCHHFGLMQVYKRGLLGRDLGGYYDRKEVVRMLEERVRVD